MMPVTATKIIHDGYKFIYKWSSGRLNLEHSRFSGGRCILMIATPAIVKTMMPVTATAIIRDE